MPYERQHVPKYYEWLQDESLLYLTGTEPSKSLTEEYEHQASWRQAKDRKDSSVILVGFIRIICEKEAWLADRSGVSSMVGDINLFMGNEGDAEINLMIGDADQRGRGLASEALTLSIANFTATRFMAKIKAENTQAIRFFAKHGFKTLTGEPNVFNEIEMTLESLALDE